MLLQAPFGRSVGFGYISGCNCCRGSCNTEFIVCVRVCGGVMHLDIPTIKLFNLCLCSSMPSYIRRC